MRRGLLGMILLTACAAAEDAEGAVPDPLPAVGIRVRSVEANQGVPVEIGRDGVGVDGPERAAALIHGRRTLVRAYWEVDEDWRPRRVEAVLRLRTHEGEERSLTSTHLIAAPADPSDLRRAWVWTLQADETPPGLQYRVELYEAEPDVDGSISIDPDASPPSTPAQGFFQVGLEPSSQVFEVVVVPVERDDGECEAKPDVSGARVGFLRDRLHMLLPVQRVQLSVRDPIVLTEPLEEFDSLIDLLGELKQDDGVDSQVYYYGLIGSCGKVGGYSGQAHSIPIVPVPTHPWARVAVGLSESDPRGTAHTMAHELGHVLGRRHIACNGNENEPDESFPYRDGSIGGWGWGVLDEQLRSPAEAADYMGYCAEDWVSDFGWNITFFFIRALGQFPQPDGSASEPLLVGSIDPDGEQRWFLSRGTLGLAQSGGFVRWDLSDGTAVRSPVLVSERPHGDTLNLVTTRPTTGGAPRSALLELAGGRTQALDLAELPRSGQ